MDGSTPILGWSTTHSEKIILVFMLILENIISNIFFLTEIISNIYKYLLNNIIYYIYSTIS